MAQAQRGPPWPGLLSGLGTGRERGAGDARPHATQDTRTSPSIGSENTGVPRDKAGGTSGRAPPPPLHLAARRRSHPAISTFPNDFLFPFEAVFFYTLSWKISNTDIVEEQSNEHPSGHPPTALLEASADRSSGNSSPRASRRRGLFPKRVTAARAVHVTSQREMQMKPPRTAPRCQHGGPQHATHTGGGTWREGNPRALWKVAWRALKNASIELPETQQSLLWVFV